MRVAAIHISYRYLARSFTVILPYFPTGTMERVDREGQIATAKVNLLCRTTVLLLFSEYLINFKIMIIVFNTCSEIWDLFTLVLLNI